MHNIYHFSLFGSLTLRPISVPIFGRLPWIAQVALTAFQIKHEGFQIGQPGLYFEAEFRSQQLTSFVYKTTMSHVNISNVGNYL